MQYFLSFFSMILILTLVEAQEEKTYECEVVGNVFCYLRNIVISSQEFDFNITTPDPFAIRSVAVQQSQLPTLGSNICKTFPNLEYIEILQVGLIIIVEGAFDECGKLQHLHISGLVIFK